MVVYADVLIVLNLFVNFFILQLTCKICKETYRFIRLIFAALVGAVFSLYIFLPETGIVTETAFRLTVCALIVLLGFGFDSIKSFLRRIGVFFAVSFLYAGGMMGIWTVFKPNNLAINNGIVYVGISPTVLISTTLFVYVILSLIRFFAKKQAYEGKRCKLKIAYRNSEVFITALVDTGHSLVDPISGSQVIIVEKSVTDRLNLKFPCYALGSEGDLPEGFRVIPYSSVGGHGLLSAFTPDSIEVESEGRLWEIKNALIALSEEPLGEDYKGIVNPETLSK